MIEWNISCKLHFSNAHYSIVCKIKLNMFIFLRSPNGMEAFWKRFECFPSIRQYFIFSHFANCSRCLVERVKVIKPRHAAAAARRVSLATTIFGIYTRATDVLDNFLTGSNYS